MATKKKKSAFWEVLSRTGSLLRVGGYGVAGVVGLFTVAKSAVGLPVILTGIAVISLATLGCAVVLVCRPSK